MKKLFTICFILFASLATNAQYGQRIFYQSTQPFTRETLNDGIYSTLNLSGALPTYAGCGRLDSIGMPRSRFVRTGSAGTSLNNRVYKIYGSGSELPNFMNSICENTNQYVMAGGLYGNGAYPVPGQGDVLILRTNGTGTLLSANHIDINGGQDEAACVERSIFQPGRFLICGFTHVGATTKAFIMKTNSNGSTIYWTRYYDLLCASGAPSHTFATSLIQDPTSGNIFVVGYTTDFSGGGCENGFISKFNNAGTHIYTRIYSDANINGLHFNSIKAVASSPGNYIIGGDYMVSNTSGGFDLQPYFMTVNLAGAAPVVGLTQILYPSTLPGAINHASGEDVTSRLNPNTSLFEYFITGRIQNFGAGTDGYIAKMGQTGNVMAIQKYGNLGKDGFHAIDAVGNGSGVRDGLTAFGEYEDITNTNLPQGCWWAKPYYNLLSGCFDSTILCFQAIITVNSVPFTPTIGTTASTTPLTFSMLNCITKKLCMANSIAGGSNLRFNEDMEGESIRLFPNPVNQSEAITLQVNAVNDETVSVDMYDIKGSLVNSLSVDCEEGINTFTLNALNLPSGIYTVRVSTANKVMHEKIVIQ